MAFFYEPKDRLELRQFDGLTNEDHFHDHLELVWLRCGSIRVRVDAAEHPMQAGDIFLSFPNQIHSYQDAAVCDGVLSIFSCRSFEDLAPVIRQSVPSCPVVAAARLPEGLTGLLENMLAADMLAQPYRDAVLKGYLGVLLGTLLPLLPLQRVDESNSNTVQSILRYCADNYQQDLTLESVAAELHISKYHISHLFSQKIRISFSDFIGTLRVQDACERLKRGAGITDACMQAGFSSIRSFNRVFLRQTGLTPLKYQKQYAQSHGGRHGEGPGTAGEK